MTGNRSLGDNIDTYVRGELSPADARDLAQAALDDPDVFAELTDCALVKSALDSRALQGSQVVRFPRKVWTAAVGAVAAAAALVLFWPGSSKPNLKPALTLANQGRPVLLASGLQSGQAPVFRGTQTDSRAPLTTGSIVSIEEDLATIDLGSLDGLDKGSELSVFRDDQSKQPIGRLQVTTVFRQRARAHIVDGKIGVKDRVRVDDAAHLDALLEQLDALYNRGDADAAYQAAEQAGRWVENANVPPVRQAELWNQLAVLRMLRADSRDVDALLNRAVSALPKSGSAYARSMNNLGVWAELQGDRRQAEARYANALKALADVPDPSQTERRAVEANVARLRGSR